MDCNDMRFGIQAGFTTGDQFESYLKDSFDVLYAEGDAGVPKMLSIGLHCRIMGRPGRAAALARVIDYMQSHDDVWFATRLEIAEHWAEQNPAPQTIRPSEMDLTTFVAEFGGIFEHSAWIAEGAHGLELGPTHDTATGIHNALARVFRSASEEQRLGVLTAHPDLAGKLAAAGELTAESTAEQAGAGLDLLTQEERDMFQDLNAQYVDRFGFPFIIAVKDNTKASILAAFHARIANDRDIEFVTACRQVERIAELRLIEKFSA
jgi:OHCU decarboxylase